MPHKLPYTPLGFLFHKAFLPTETSYAESGTKFSLRPLPGETILMFRTDDRGKKTKEKNRHGEGTFCDNFDIGRTEKCSDALLFYAFEKPDNSFQYRLVFLELKGLNAPDAVEQLDRVMRAVRSKLPRILWESFFKSKCVRALIVSSRASPDPSFDRKVAPFYKEWKTSPTLCGTSEDEIRKHLQAEEHSHR